MSLRDAHISETVRRGNALGNELDVADPLCPGLRRRACGTIVRNHNHRVSQPAAPAPRWGKMGEAGGSSSWWAKAHHPRLLLIAAPQGVDGRPAPAMTCN